jgi:O-antigen/teichoic acid export membrane protein
MASGHFLRASVGLVSLAILARVLTVDHYATYRQTMLAYVFISPLLILGLPDVLYHFMPADKERARGVLGENLLLLAVMGVVFSLFLCCGGNRLLAWRFDNADLALTLMVFAPYSMFMLPARALDACLLARDKPGLAAAFNVLSRVVLLVIVITAALIWRTSTAAIVAVVISAAITLGPAIALMFSATKGTGGRMRWSGAGSQLKLSVPLALGGMVIMMSAHIDKVIVSSMCSLREVAVYMNGAIELPLIDVVTTSAMCVILPELTVCFKDGRPDDLLKLWRRTVEKCLVVLAPAMAFVLVMAPELMTVLFSSTYTESAYPLRIYALLLPLRATQLATVFIAAGRSGFVTLAATIGLAVNVVLSILFVGWMGPTGAAWATVISIYAMTACAFVAIGSVLKCGLTDVIRFGRVGGIIVTACLPGAVIYLLRDLLPGGMVIRLCVLAPVFAILLVIAYHITGIVATGRIVRAILRRGRAEDVES